MNDTPMAYFSPLNALSYLPAPLFWDTNADIDCAKADGISMIKAQTFSATPTPADAITPRQLTIARITRKEIPTRKSCNATGAPINTIFLRISFSLLKHVLSSLKGSSFFLISHNDIKTLISCAATVAKAAPFVPISKPATRIKSPMILHTHAIDTVISGVIESPSPLKILPIRL